MFPPARSPACLSCLTLLAAVATLAALQPARATDFQTHRIESVTSPRPSLPRNAYVDTDVLPLAGNHVFYRLEGVLRHAYGAPGYWSFDTVTSDASNAFDCASLSVAFRHLGGSLVVASWDGSAWTEDVVTGETDSVATISLAEGPGVHLAYVAESGGAFEVRYARRDPGGWTIEPVAAIGASASQVSIAIGRHGEPRVAYFRPDPRDGVGRDLCLAWRDGDVGAFAIDVVDSGDVGSFLSLAADASTGDPRVAFERFDRDLNDFLAYAFREGSAGAWTTQTVDSLLYDLQFVSLELDMAGSPRIAYTTQVPIVQQDARRGVVRTDPESGEDVVSGEVRVAWRNGGPGVAPFTTDYIDEYDIRTTSLALSPSGQPIVVSRRGQSAPPYDILLSTPSTPAGVISGASVGLLARVAPNPRRGLEPLRMEILLPRDEVVALELFDLEGRRVTGRAPEAMSAGPTTLHWPLGRLRGGLYWVRARTTSGLEALGRWVVLP